MASTSYKKHSFHTLARENQFSHPSKEGADIPILNEFVTPHIESFNALFDDSDLPLGDGDGTGLLSMAIADIGERVVFDGKGAIGTSSGQGGWGNRLSCTLQVCLHNDILTPAPLHSLDRASVHRPSYGLRSRQGGA